MHKFQAVLNSGLLTVAATVMVSVFGVSRAHAASYTYTLINATGLTGFITTSCDNCVLNTSNITAWSMTVPGVLDISSTAPGAQLTVPAGDTDMVATPGGISFQFSGSVGGFTFSGPSGNLGYDDAQNGNIGFGPGAGIIAACSSSGACSFLGGGNGAIQIGAVAVPFVGSVGYTFTGKVTSATGIYAGAGATVSGTFTFDLNAGDGALPVSLTAPWSSSSTGPSRVAGSTLTSGSVTFSDAGSTSNKTTVAGLSATGSSAPSEFFASDTESSSATNSVQQSIQIAGGTGANAPFNANGLPLFQNATGTGTLVATTGNATVGQLTYTITSLTAAPTTLSVSPASLTFPDTLLNTQSVPLTVSITNTSPNDASIDSLGFNPDSGNFRITTNNCPSVLLEKASCTASIVFAPVGSAGQDQTAFNVTDDAQGSPQSVSLAGTATVSPAPVATLSTAGLTFTNQRIGTTSAELPVTLKNTGTAPLTIFSIGVVANASFPYQADAFTLRSACVSTLAPGKACTVFVTFKPLMAGQASAAVVISDNVVSPSTGGFAQSIPVGGTGTTAPVPGLTFNVPSLTFANQTTGTTSLKQAFDLTNTGTLPLKISSIALAGSQASDFVLQNACVSTLPAGQHCAVFVTFKPSTAGDLEAAVIVTSNAGGALSVPLYGTATKATAPVLTLNTTNLRFGNATEAVTQAVDLTNTGTAPLSLSSIAIVGTNGQQAYFTLRNACVPVLAPGKLCALFVTFNPMTATEELFATLVINDNAEMPQQTVQLFAEAP